MTSPTTRNLAAASRPPTSARPAIPLLATVAGTAAFGDAAAMVTLMLRLSSAPGASWAISALLFAILGPSAVLAPVTARFLARTGKWRGLVLASAAQAAAAAALIAARGTAPTLALVTVIGAGLAVTQPALLEITPTVVAAGRLDWVNSVIRGAGWTGWTIGPVTAGALCAAGLAWAALSIEAVSFVVAGACFAMLSRAPATRTDSHGAKTGGREPGPGRARETWRYIRRDRHLAALIAAVAVINVCIGMTGVAEVFFATGALHTGSVGFASLESAWAAGIVAGTLAAPWAAARRPALAAIAGTGAAGAGVLAASTAGGLAAAQAAYAIAGVGFGLQATLLRGMIQRRAAGPMLAPVCRLWVATDMSTQLGGYLAGGAALLAGPRPALAIAGAGLCSVCFLAIVLAGRSGPVLRRVQHERP